ncbi:MAG: helix-turn-helix domain-containing protein [Ruminococcus sp.]|nr:helix-turn-helix domain-containing protein [Ruminococcus sp.]
MLIIFIISNIILIILAMCCKSKMKNDETEMESVNKSKIGEQKISSNEPTVNVSHSKKERKKFSDREKKSEVKTIVSDELDNTHSIITVTQAVELLEVSRATIYNMISSRRLKAQKENGRWKIEIHSLNEKIRGHPYN